MRNCRPEQDLPCSLSPWLAVMTMASHASNWQDRNSGRPLQTRNTNSLSRISAVSSGGSSQKATSRTTGLASACTSNAYHLSTFLWLKCEFVPKTEQDNGGHSTAHDSSSRSPRLRSFYRHLPSNCGQTRQTDAWDQKRCLDSGLGVGCLDAPAASAIHRQHCAQQNASRYPKP